MWEIHGGKKHCGFLHDLLPFCLVYDNIGRDVIPKSIQFLMGFTDLHDYQLAHKSWVERYLQVDVAKRESQWAESLADRCRNDKNLLLG